MNDTKRLLELALKGLEVERARINQEITDIQSQINRSGSRLPSRGRIPAAKVSEKSSIKTAAASPKRRRMSAAARKKLSDAAKRRWVVSKKAGKSTL
jgi:hypothetical protein